MKQVEPPLFLFCILVAPGQPLKFRPVGLGSWQVEIVCRLGMFPAGLALCRWGRATQTSQRCVLRACSPLAPALL